MSFPGLTAIDLRNALPAPLANAPATGKPQGTRPATRYLVVHWNGPTAPSRAGGSRLEIVGWLKDTIIPNHKSRIGADGVQYHYWIGRDGTIYQLRDYWDLLWHCGNADGNDHGLAVHIPIGQGQKPTQAQLDALERLALAAIAMPTFDLKGRAGVRGHLEFAPSDCPGPDLMGWLRSWRAAPADPWPAWGAKGFPIGEHEKPWDIAQAWLAHRAKLGAAVSPHVFPYGNSQFVYVLFERGVISKWEGRPLTIQGAFG